MDRADALQLTLTGPFGLLRVTGASSLVEFNP